MNLEDDARWTDDNNIIPGIHVTYGPFILCLLKFYLITRQLIHVSSMANVILQTDATYKVCSHEKRHLNLV